MVKSINENSRLDPCCSPKEPVAVCCSPREAPSALTALNILQTNHNEGIKMLNDEVKKVKKSEKDKTAELDRLRNTLRDSFKL